jgi:hypothetical protein
MLSLLALMQILIYLCFAITITDALVEAGIEG